MNGHTLTQNLSSFTLPVIAVLTAVTLVRLSGLVLDIADQELPSALSRSPAQEDASRSSGTEKKKNPDREVKAVSYAPVKGLPEYVKKESMLYFIINDYRNLSKQIQSTSIHAVWDVPGIKEAAANIILESERMWKGFNAKYKFPVEKIFKGLGPNVGRIEVAVTDFTRFRGTYSIRLAACCEIKGDAKAFIRTFSKNSGSAFKKEAVYKTVVYKKEEALGTLSVFFKENRMYVTAGKRMNKSLIERLKLKPLNKGKRFADNEELQRIYSGLKRKDSDTLLFISQAMVKELSEGNMGILKGSFGLSTYTENGLVTEEILLPAESMAGYISERGRIIPSPQTDNIIAEVILGLCICNFRFFKRQDQGSSCVGQERGNAFVDIHGFDQKYP
jgi:hypothetical protein